MFGGLKPMLEGCIMLNHHHCSPSPVLNTLQTLEKCLVNVSMYSTRFVSTKPSIQDLDLESIIHVKIPSSCCKKNSMIDG